MTLQAELEQLLEQSHADVVQTILATVSKHFPEKNTDEEWFTVPSGQRVQDKDLHNYKVGRNTAITEMEKTLGADHE